MKELIRKFEKESGLEIYGLGARREKWEHCMEKFTELVVRECVSICKDKERPNLYGIKEVEVAIKQHFGIIEPKGWVCPKCKADRTKIPCPLGFGAQVDGRCPMTAEAQ
jgi:hypothetical protein